MNEAAQKFDPTEYFRLNDICLWESKLERGMHYQPDVHEETSVLQFKRGFATDFYLAKGSEGEDLEILQVLVSLGIRCVVEGGKEEEGGERDEAAGPDRTEESDEASVGMIYLLEATFAVDFEIIKAPQSPKGLHTFIEKNCLHTIWPFWRQHVYDTMKRASLPVPTIPLMSGVTKAIAEPPPAASSLVAAIQAKKS